MIGRETWYDRGALALRCDGSGFVMESARPKNYDRPWAPAWRSRTADSANGNEAGRLSLAVAPRGATPLEDDLEADQ